MDPSTLRGPVLDDLEAERDYDFECYAVDNESTYDKVGQAMVKLICPYYEIYNGDDKYKDFSEELDSMYEQIIDSYRENYDKNVEEFKKTAATAPDKLESKEIFYETELFRADQQMLSLALIGANRKTGNAESVVINVDVYTDKSIEIDDIITDKDAFFELVGKYCSDETKADLLGKYGEDFPFGLTYDGIFVFDSISDPYEGDWVKIPLQGLALADQKYFQATPANFTVFLDRNMDLLWDLDYDGQNDTFHVDSKYNDDGSFDIQITINGKTTDLKDLTDKKAHGVVKHAFIMHTEMAISCT